MQWYNYLVTRPGKISLLGSEIYKKGKMMVCWQRETRKYGMFDTVDDFLSFLSKTPKKDRCFYEIIMGTEWQKPHFDIDIPGENMTEIGENTIASVLSAIDKVMVDIECTKPYECLVTSAHGKKKRSYHVVLAGVAHVDNKNAKGFYQRVVDEIPSDYREYIDPKLYNPHQQFRILGCTKYKSTRRKKRDTHTDMSYQEAVHLSLASYTKGCSLIPDTAPHDKSYGFDIEQEGEELSSKELKDAMDICRHAFKGRPPFVLKELRGRLLILDRTRPSYCETCDRVHEADNPFAYVSESGDVMFNCRRGDSSRMLGNVNVRDLDERIDDIDFSDDETTNEVNSDERSESSTTTSGAKAKPRPPKPQVQRGKGIMSMMSTMASTPAKRPRTRFGLMNV